MSKITELSEELWDSGDYETKKAVAVEIVKRLKLDADPEAIRKKISKHLNKRNYEGAISHANEMNIDFKAVDHGWIKTKDASFHFKNKEDLITYEDVRDGILDEMSKYSPKYPTIKRTKVKDGHALFIGLTDIHLGAVTDILEGQEEYNTNIAVQRCLEGVQGLLDKSSGFNIDKIILQIAGDAFHADGLSMKTTRGTGPFLLSEPWYRTFSLAKQMYVDIIEILMQIAPVECLHIPGNHDTVSGAMICDTLESWFRNSKDVTFDSGPRRRKYTQYHSNAIMVSHGDGGKEANLPLTFAHEAKQLWSDTDHRYVFLGHIHHKQAKDYMGVTVEYLRSPKPSDEWHSKNQYHYAPKAVEGFIFHKTAGQVARLSHIF